MKKAALATLVVVCLAASAEAQSLSADDLARRTIERRAIEVINWGMPAVNFDLMLQAAMSAKAKINQIVFWSRLPDWKNQTLTPNPDVIYLMPLFDTKEVGPMVMEIPPAGPGGSITGSIDDGWQTALEDVGPAGVDKGKGGKYLILPPGYKGKTGSGYIVLQSLTYQSYALLRSNLASGSDADVAKAAAYGKRVKVYPLSQAKNPPATIFVDAIDIVFDSTIPGDLRFFEALDHFVQHEPWIDRDRVMIDMLKSIGIEKGRTFAPDQSTQAVLKDAISEARAWLDDRYEGIFTTSFNEGRQWALPALPGLAEGIMTNFAWSERASRPGRSSARHSRGLGGNPDKDATYLGVTPSKNDGSTIYKLTVKNVPVEAFWSVSVYNEQGYFEKNPYDAYSVNNITANKEADGSVTIQFGGCDGKIQNCLPIMAGWNYTVRLYRPRAEVLNGKWKFPEPQVMN